MNARRIPLSLIVVGALLVGVLALIALVSLAWLPYPIEDTSGGRLEGFSGSSHFGVWGVVLAWGRGLPDD